MDFPLEKKCKNCFESSIAHLAHDKISINLEAYTAVNSHIYLQPSNYKIMENTEVLFALKFLRINRYGWLSWISSEFSA